MKAIPIGAIGVITNGAGLRCCSGVPLGTKVKVAACHKTFPGRYVVNYNLFGDSNWYVEGYINATDFKVTHLPITKKGRKLKHGKQRRTR